MVNEGMNFFGEPVDFNIENKRNPALIDFNQDWTVIKLTSLCVIDTVIFNNQAMGHFDMEVFYSNRGPFIKSYEFGDSETEVIKIPLGIAKLIKIKSKNESSGHTRSIFLTKEIGPFKGFPLIKRMGLMPEQKPLKLIDGKYYINKIDSNFKLQLSFKDYPQEYTGDLDILSEISSLDSFVFMFKYKTNDKLYRNQLGIGQAFKCTVLKNSPFSFSRGVYSGGINTNIEIVEVV